jgi:hypothetical protein
VVAALVEARLAVQAIPPGSYALDDGYRVAMSRVLRVLSRLIDAESAVEHPAGVSTPGGPVRGGIDDDSGQDGARAALGDSPAEDQPDDFPCKAVEFVEADPAGFDSEDSPAEDQPACKSCGHYHAALCLTDNPHLDCDCPPRSASPAEDQPDPNCPDCGQKISAHPAWDGAEAPAETSLAVCEHGKTGRHELTRTNYPVPGCVKTMWCPGPASPAEGGER